MRGRDADARRAVRQDRTKPILDSFKSWLGAQLTAVSQKAAIAGAIRYTLWRWAGVICFLDDSRIELDSITVERAIRPIVLNRKNALFAGSDGVGEHWTILASLIETCKLNGLDPQAWLTDVFGRLVSGHPINRLDELLPWASDAQRA
ncbi:IS66 family transposase [Reyranella sp. CPCC 100927]|nr:IS66 family transposase [Reyranella sp. CPCC 100927]